MPMESSTISRRNFIQLAGGATLGFVFMSLNGCESNSVDPIATGSDIPFLTPVKSFYFKNGAEGSIERWTMPVISRTTWRLKIDGLVSTPQSIRYDDIRLLADSPGTSVKLLKTMRCVIDSNEVQGLVGTAIWTGVPLRYYLDKAGVEMSRARRLIFYGADGYENNIRIDRVYGSQQADLVEPLLVTRINGQQLPEEHGFPVRLMLHEAFGFKCVKWLTRIEAVESDAPRGTYQDQGFADDGEIKVISRMTSPLANVTVPAGLVLCVGFAVSGADGIEGVDISVDGGPFIPAKIDTESEVIASDQLLESTLQTRNPEDHPYPYRAVWAKWRHSFDARPGEHTIAIKARDRSGNTQPERDNDISDGINAIGTVKITAV